MFRTNGIKICQIVLSANFGDVFHIDITFKPKTVRLAYFFIIITVSETQTNAVNLTVSHRTFFAYKRDIMQCWKKILVKIAG